MRSRLAGATPALRDPNPYMFGDHETDRARLDTQARLFGTCLRHRARDLAGPQIRHILDLGCGEGQLGQTLLQVYPDATLLGIDKDARAIAHAQERARGRGLSNATYLSGDLTETWPAGVFDLIHCSLILLHLRRPEETVRRAYAALAPGGYLWIKELHPSIEHALITPAYRQLMGWTYAAMARIGAHPYLAQELPAVLPAAGFTELHTEIEEYPLGGQTAAGRAMLGVLLAVPYNARALLAQVHGVPESTVLALTEQASAWARSRPEQVGTLRVVNLIARRPATDA